DVLSRSRAWSLSSSVCRRSQFPEIRPQVGLLSQKDLPHHRLDPAGLPDAFEAPVRIDDLSVADEIDGTDPVAVLDAAGGVEQSRGPGEEYGVRRSNLTTRDRSPIGEDVETSGDPALPEIVVRPARGESDGGHSTERHRGQAEEEQHLADAHLANPVDPVEH